MKKIMIVLFIIILAGCDKIALPNDMNEGGNAPERAIKASQLEDDNLKVGIACLQNESQYSLEIGTHESEFLQTSDYVASRIFELLVRNLENEQEDAEMAEYQLILRFDGYKDIYVDIENEKAWFEDADVSYHIEGIGTLWDNYIIKLNHGEYEYFDFEKTILTAFDGDVDNDGIQDEVVLFYDNDIRLRINRHEVIIRKNAVFDNVGIGKTYYSGKLDENAHLEYIKNLNLLLYTYEGQSIRGPFTNIKFYKVLNDTISEIKFEVECKIDTVDLEAGTIDLSFPPSDLTYQLKMSEQEVKDSKLIQSEVTIDVSEAEIYEHNLRESPLIGGYQLTFKDYDGDGELEMILLGRIQTKFASSYINIDENIVLVFDLCADKITCTNIFLERDATKANSPFHYFE